MNHWVMDYETLSNCFTAVFEHYKTEERKIFVIHELRDDRNEFIKFLEQNVKKRFPNISRNLGIKRTSIPNFPEFGKTHGDSVVYLTSILAELN